MNNSIDPKDNHYNNDILDEEENDVEENEEQEILDDEDDDDTSQSNNKNNISKEQYRVKMLKLFAIIIVVFVLVLLLASLFFKTKGKKYSYEDVETVMEKAAKAYFKEHKDSLPVSDKSNVEIHDDVLTEEKYMKSIDSYIDKKCSGKVIVKKITTNNYSYTSYLDCGESYTTKKLYDKIVKDTKKVTSGYGLYEINGEYVYRGEGINNYVKFKDSDTIWRIVKITSDNDIVLIHASKSKNPYSWDERYNNVFKYNSGINVYNKSEIESILKILYKGYFGDKEDPDYKSVYYKFINEVALLTKEDKAKLNTYKSCVNQRAEDDTSRDGSTECSVTEDVKYGMLPVYDFMNASIDPACTTTISPECQNYNYLSEQDNYWLANGSSTNSSKVYYVSNGDFIRERQAAQNSYIRAVIHLNDDVMIYSGNGSHKKPYVIR